jgi:anti-sigma-K factor RskA
MSAHEQFAELAGAYALGALDSEDLAAFEQHWPTCAECQQLVADARLVAGMLPLALTPVEPPAALRNRIMMSAAPPATPSVTTNWLAIAATLLAVVAGGLAWTQYRQAATSQAAATQSQAQLETMQAQLSALQSQADVARQAVDILAADDVARVELKGQPAAPSSTGRAYWSASRGLLFSAVNLPALPQGRVYQLWYVTATAPVSAALVTPDAAGRFTVITPSPAGVTPTAFAVTIEPAGGLPAPSGAFYLLSEGF